MKHLAGVAKPGAPRLLAVLLVAAALVLVFSSRLSSQATGTEYVTFWSGDLRIFALEDQTEVELIDIDTGSPLILTGASKDSRINSTPAPTFGTNPFTIPSAGDSFEARGGLGGLNAEIRVQVIADKPVTVWTGSNLTTSNNPWMSYIPAFTTGSSSNGSEVGREFLGFTSKEMYVIVRKGGAPTVVQIDDLATNNDSDTDDTQTLTPASAALEYSDSDVEFYRVTGFEDDTVRITTNADASVLVGLSSQIAKNWTATPPSYAAGDDGIELGTLFYTFVKDALTVFPTQDNTTITITDLTDAGGADDDTTTVTLTNGDTVGDYDFYTTEQKPTAKRSSGPSVTVTLGPDGAFENDYVKVESDKPVLAYVGPAASDINEYADVAFSVPTGTDSRIIYAYAQNSGSSNDLQIFGFDPDTEVTITSLTRTIGFRTATFHDFTIGPGVGGATGWLEGVSGEVWWGSDVWSGEMLRIESTKPITVINGDYDTPHFGAYIPFVLTTPDLPPVAVADADPSTVCTGDLVSLDGSGSFDQDSLGVDPAIVSYEWDVDISFDSDGDGNPANDVDASGVTPTVSYTSAGTFIVKLTVTDNEGQTDTDFVAIEVEQCNEPPDCSNAAASSDTLWPPNHKMVSINVVGVTDPDGDPITITIDSIFQDEPVDTTGDGKFSPDGKGVGTDTAQVRAERTGNKKVPGNGRVYHIGYTATDDEGAACPPGQLVLVGVPHDQGKGKTPIDDGPLFDSTEFVPGTGDK